jgi:hypothetical protein
MTLPGLIDVYCHGAAGGFPWRWGAQDHRFLLDPDLHPLKERIASSGGATPSRSGKCSTAWRRCINAPFTLVGGENVILVTGSMDATGLLDGGYDLCPQAFASVTARPGFAAMVPSPADLPPCLRFALRDYRSWRKHRQRRLTRSPCPNPWPPGRSREAPRVAARRRCIGGP